MAWTGLSNVFRVADSVTALISSRIKYAFKSESYYRRQDSSWFAILHKLCLNNQNEGVSLVEITWWGLLLGLFGFCVVGFSWRHFSSSSGRQFGSGTMMLISSWVKETDLHHITKASSVTWVSKSNQGLRCPSFIWESGDKYAWRNKS